MSRISMAHVPAIHIVASATAVRPWVISQMGPPRALSGAAQPKCSAQTLSTVAPTGTMKLNAVTTQIQYFAVALALRIDVNTHAAAPTREA